MLSFLKPDREDRGAASGGAEFVSRYFFDTVDNLERHHGGDPPPDLEPHLYIAVEGA